MRTGVDLGKFIKHKTIIDDTANITTLLYYENGKITNIDSYNHKKRCYESISNEIVPMDNDSVIKEIKAYEEKERMEREEMIRLMEGAENLLHEEKEK